ncbi:hypothetical protein TELCIR_09168 [Teladorsagia circumcincta]|uniref:Uncharacterized protein n=1 Tax=Teladorsagia circumcincta TaxID=45464 RepID=A0A2G9UFK1_TELCI|nr:hypothetical protein TELCIR_09168 [Teladorsagia circumcincta]
MCVIASLFCILAIGVQRGALRVSSILCKHIPVCVLLSLRVHRL